MRLVQRRTFKESGPNLNVVDEVQGFGYCTCTTLGGDNYGFTSPRPGWWVHAACGLPTYAFAQGYAKRPATDSWPTPRVLR